MNENQQYGQLLDNSTTLWAERTGWFPFKWITVGFLRSAARDPHYHQAAGAKVAAMTAPKLAGDDPSPPAPPPLPSLTDLVSMAFDLVLTMYAAQLPFGGYWIRAA